MPNVGMATNARCLYLDFLTSNLTAVPLIQRKEERRKAKQVPKGERTGEGHSSGCATMGRGGLCVRICV